MNQSSLSLRVLKLILGFLWWGTIVGSVAGIGYLVVITMFSPEKIEYGFVAFARDVDTSSLTATMSDGMTGRVEFEEPVKIKVNVAEWRPGKLWLAGVLAMVGAGLGLFLYFLSQFRGIVRTMESGDPFVSENARRVRVIGLLILFGGFAHRIGEGMASAVADSMFVTEGFDLSARFGLDLPSLFAGLSIIALSEVFRQGAKMREEQALTV